VNCMARARNKAQNNSFKQELINEIVGIATIALGLFIAYCLWLGPGENKTIGAVGSVIYSTILALFGDGKVYLPVLFLIIGIGKLLRRSKWDKLTVISWTLLFVSLLVFFHLQLPAEERTIATGWQGTGGGVIGALLAVFALTLFGEGGSYIFLGACALLAVLGIAKKPLGLLVRQLLSGLVGFFAKTREELSEFLFEQAETREENKRVPKASTPAKEPIVPVIINHEEDSHPRESNIGIPGVPAFQERPVLRLVKEKENPPVSKKEEQRAKENSESNQPVPSYHSDFKMPPLDLLVATPRIKSQRLNKDITENIRTLEQTLESFGIKARVTQVSRGPSITRYELQPAPGIKVSRIVSLADDIALSLAATHVRIEAPIPGKAAVGIEVPNEEISMVSLREVLESSNFQESTAKLTIALGKDIAGNPIVADLGKMPHLLIAGATGSGKSVCMNAIIASILYNATPDEVKLLMVDPNVVELTNYNGIPHLISPVVTDPKKAASSLRWAVHEMENRYELFAATGVKDIVRYNQAKKEEDPTGTYPLLPYIVVLIDELADLMMVAPADVEDAICRLAQMARAAGIHLVVATQRPSVDVITGVIKANIPSRIAFAVSSQTDSRTILDMAGAERLLGRGDMLFYPTGMAKPIRVQGVYVSDQEIENLVEYLKAQKNPQYITTELQVEQEAAEDSEDDELLPEAARIFIESGQASISLLQRRLRIGYTRAARIIDQLEQKGIVGGYEGSKPRAIRMTWEEYERTFGG